MDNGFKGFTSVCIKSKAKMASMMISKPSGWNALVKLTLNSFACTISPFNTNHVVFDGRPVPHTWA